MLLCYHKHVPDLWRCVFFVGRNCFQLRGYWFIRLLHVAKADVAAILLIIILQNCALQYMPFWVDYIGGVSAWGVWCGCWVTPDSPQAATINARGQPSGCMNFGSREKKNVCLGLEGYHSCCVDNRWCPRGQSEKKSERVCNEHACHNFDQKNGEPTTNRKPYTRDPRSAVSFSGFSRFWNHACYATTIRHRVIVDCAARILNRHLTCRTACTVVAPTAVLRWPTRYRRLWYRSVTGLLATVAWKISSLWLDPSMEVAQPNLLYSTIKMDCPITWFTCSLDLYLYILACKLTCANRCYIATKWITPLPRWNSIRRSCVVFGRDA